MDYHTPQILFSDIQPRDRGATAFDAVASLDENQLRFALWATLVTCFGHPSSNSPELVADSWPVDGPIQDVHYLLAQLGIAKGMPEVVNKMRLSIQFRDGR